MKLFLHRNMLTIHIQETTTVDNLLQHLGQNKKRRYFLYQQRLIQIKHQPITQSCALEPKDIITIHLQHTEKDDFIPSYQNIDIVYEDDIFCIVSKPSGILVHPDGIQQTDTMANRIKAYYLQQGILAPVRAIHRLDVDTSGLLVFCKLPFFQPMLDQLLADKKIYRTYTAFVQGNISRKHFTIEKAIGKDRHQSNKMRISVTGKYAKTDVTRIKNYRGYAQIQCSLHTGRTHQIRVHLASMQHAILSDPIYGSPSSNIARLALHAHALTIFHPIQQTYLTLHAPLPNDMKQLIQ